MSKLKSSRRYDLDWIKVLATFIVFLYHCSMFFNPFEWHVKNNEIDAEAILAFSLYIGVWIMPIFFVISGLSSYYSLQKRSGSQYIRERLARLGIPLLFGIFILTPPQVYIERVYLQQFSGSFLDFLPHAYEGVYLEMGGPGNFAFVGLHLWYLLALILFSFLTLGLFLKTKPFKKVTGIKLFLLHIPFILLTSFVETVKLGGWDLLVYLMYFLFGFYVFTSESLLNYLEKTRWIHYTLAILPTTAYIIWFFIEYPDRGTVGFVIFSTLLVIGSINILLSIYHLGHTYLSFNNKLLTYASEAAMPFYIIHQPVIVIIGFFIKDLSWPIGLKLVFLICISFIIIMGIYHYVVRNLSPIRILFGLKGKKNGPPIPTNNQQM
ncbi:acyltransferase family protein [Cytobacillus spongiae]|uniref:acyltransferase family protein n=1 Tax=Cytobacillus spongiae TaxID=2901381 RepID=UPI001F44D323|nr:acyltransferase family protein [Cytobacillus spongiae]UII56413.1 acyltransferase family protein [Cytobacillus spongiae]